MEFCPKCGKRLTPLKKKNGAKVALLLSCPKCGYEKRATRSRTTVSKILEYSSQGRLAVLGKVEQKLRTLPKVRIECPRCGNGLASAWTARIRGLEESSTQFFRCTKCNYTFRENSQEEEIKPSKSTRIRNLERKPSFCGWLHEEARVEK